jgi:diaminopimelate epimerase
LAFNESKTEVVLGTQAGPRACEVESPVDQGLTEFYIRTEMGIPIASKIIIDVDDIGPVGGAIVNVGNPHFVLFVEDESFRAHNLAWQELGAILCTHIAFPQGANVEFVYKRNDGEIAFRIYERGCGPTKSSGTGTCASAAAAIKFDECDRELTAYAEGGMQKVVWPADDMPIKLTGPARIIYEGEVAAL